MAKPSVFFQGFYFKYFQQLVIKVEIELSKCF